MTHVELAEALHILGWNQKRAALELGVTEGAVSRWVLGYRGIPGPVVRLMRDWVRREERRKKRQSS